MAMTFKDKWSFTWRSFFFKPLMSVLYIVNNCNPSVQLAASRQCFPGGIWGTSLECLLPASKVLHPGFAAWFRFLSSRCWQERLRAESVYGICADLRPPSISSIPPIKGRSHLLSHSKYMSVGDNSQPLPQLNIFCYWIHGLLSGSRQLVTVARNHIAHSVICWESSGGNILQMSGIARFWMGQVLLRSLLPNTIVRIRKWQVAQKG